MDGKSINARRVGRVTSSLQLRVVRLNRIGVEWMISGSGDENVSLASDSDTGPTHPISSCSISNALTAFGLSVTHPATHPRQPVYGLAPAGPLPHASKIIVGKSS